MDKQPEFFVRQSMLGALVLQVRHFKDLPISGTVRDARPSDLPEFFAQLIGKQGVK